MFKSGDKLKFTEKWKNEALANGYSKDSIERVFTFVCLDKALFSDEIDCIVKCEKMKSNLRIKKESLELCLK